SSPRGACVRRSDRAARRAIVGRAQFSPRRVGGDARRGAARCGGRMPHLPQLPLAPLRRALPASDAIVAGAGPAGSAAAIGLARAGAKPLLLERARETGDALCGGFLSWQTLARLDALGIQRASLGGQAVRRVRLFAGK